MHDCNHRKCAIVRLVIMIRNSADYLSDDDRDKGLVVVLGLKALETLGVTRVEIEDAVTFLISEALDEELTRLPTMGHVHNYPTVSTGNGEDSEWKPCPHTKP